MLFITLSVAVLINPCVYENNDAYYKALLGSIEDGNIPLFTNHLSCNVNLGCKVMNKQCKSIVQALSGPYLDVFLNSKTRLKSQQMLKWIAILNASKPEVFSSVIIKIKDPQEMYAIANVIFDYNLPIDTIKIIFENPIYASSHVNDIELRLKLVTGLNCYPWVYSKSTLELELKGLGFCHNLPQLLERHETTVYVFLGAHLKKISTSVLSVEYIFNYLFSISEDWIKRSLARYSMASADDKTFLIKEITILSLEKSSTKELIAKSKKKNDPTLHADLTIAAEQQLFGVNTVLLQELLETVSQDTLFQLMHKISDIYSFHSELLNLAFELNRVALKRFIIISKHVDVYIQLFKDENLEDVEKMAWITKILEFRENANLVQMLKLKSFKNDDRAVTELLRSQGHQIKEELLLWAVVNTKNELVDEIVGLYKSDFDVEALGEIEEFFIANGIKVPLRISERLSDVCCICTEQYSGKVKQLDCGHSLHASCAKSWFKYKKSCPKCSAKCITGAKRQRMNKSIL